MVGGSGRRLREGRGEAAVKGTRVADGIRPHGYRLLGDQPAPMRCQPAIGTNERRVAQIRVAAQGLDVAHHGLGKLSGACADIAADQVAQPAFQRLGYQ
jgi:hypothetical protein